MSCSEFTFPKPDDGRVSRDSRRPWARSRSRSVSTVASSQTARRIFAHAARVTTDKEVDVVVNELHEDTTEKKKKGIKAWFGWKK